MEVNSWFSEEFHQTHTNVNVADYTPSVELKLRGFRLGLFSAYTILLSIGAAGNCWVISVIGRLLRQPRTEAPRSVQIYIFALCCCDLVALIFLSFLLIDLAYGHWMIPFRWLCKLYMASESVTKFGTPFLLTSLTSFCYVTICRGQYFQSNPTLTNRSIQKLTSSHFCVTFRPTSSKFAMIMVCVCAMLVLISVAPIYNYSDISYVVVKNGSQIYKIVPKCILQPPERVLTIFTYYSFILAFLIPSVLVTFFYSSVLYYVRKNAKFMRAEKSQKFWRVAKTSMGLVGFYLICWTPYWTMSLYSYFTPQFNTGSTTYSALILSYFLHMLPYINCSGYPILYTLLNRRIRDDYSKAKAVSRERRRRQAAARGSIFSDLSSATGSHTFVHPIVGAFTWIWALGHRQRYHIQGGTPQRSGHAYHSTETNSFDASTNQMEESVKINARSQA